MAMAILAHSEPFKLFYFRKISIVIFSSRLVKTRAGVCAAAHVNVVLHRTSS